MGHGTFLAIDIGGTYIKSAFFDIRQKMYGHTRVKTGDNIDVKIVDQVKHIIEQAKETENIDGVGISTAGIVDRYKGEIIYAGPTIPHYSKTALKAELSQSSSLPVTIENDVNAALLGEVWKGAGRGMNRLYCITLGTGIGGAYFDNGIVDGHHLQAHSVGYLLYDEQTKTNYEMRASTSALNNKVKAQYGSDMSTADIFTRAKNGDSGCMTLIEEWATEIAKGLAQIILVNDPACIIIGGGVSAQGHFLLRHVQNKVDMFLPQDFLKTDIKMAQLTNHAALYGAVYPFFKGRKQHVR
ncbi:MAG TPA: ROK family protein [Bacillota bacterium]|nr:ROK family protein [Bacillota bacterium]